MARRLDVRKFTMLIVVLVAAGLLLAQPLPLPSPIGQSDFRAYWSTGYLLARGDHFLDPARLLQIQIENTGWREHFVMLTWNPPWLFVLLIPYTIVSFQQAAGWWLITNILLVFLSAVAIWRVSVTHQTAGRQIWIPVFIAFAYSPISTALIAGQVNILVLAGLAGYLHCAAQGHALRSGATLALTTVKPHLVYVILPILLLEALRRRRWRVLAGFIGALVGLSAIVLVLQPRFLSEYSATVASGDLFNYATPTLGGWLHLQLGWPSMRLIGLIVLPFSIWAWWRHGEQWDKRSVIDVALLLSIITMPFGWSYDFIVLLVPIMRIVAWIVEGKLRRTEALMYAAGLFVINTLMFYQRVQAPHEAHFVWVPIAIAGLYALALKQRSARLFVTV